MNNNQASQSSSTKVERRVVEKNRRNHMKLLYSNLFSLLPNQNPKEPLSLPEQIDEAINYIKSRESKLQKSKEKKESLVGTRKRSHATSFVNVESMKPNNLSIESGRSTKAPQIQIHETGSTVEVVLTSGLDNHQFIFYEIIRILDEEQADVVHASFSTLGDTTFHVVRAEMHKSVLDFGAARITEKLNRFVNGSTSDQELQQDGFWDFEFEPVGIIWDQLTSTPRNKLINPISSVENAFPSFSSAASNSISSDVFATLENQLNLPGKPIKVYLYDLPKRFTYGVIEHHSLARGGRPDDDVSKLKYPGHQHMGEWYLFQDLLKPESERVGSPVERVLDPEEADLFYVPFFSSLSLIVNPARPASGSEKPLYSDEENQVALIEWLESQEYWKRNNGLDHVIMALDPNALYKVIDKVKNCVLLVCD
ncbi:hypothetical protein ACFX15_046177 [Malus domestica]